MIDQPYFNYAPRMGSLLGAQVSGALRRQVTKAPRSPVREAMGSRATSRQSEADGHIGMRDGRFTPRLQTNFSTPSNMQTACDIGGVAASTTKDGWGS